MFEHTEDQRALAEAVRDFCQDAIAPTVKEDDERELFRKDLIQAMGEQGFCGITTDEQYGGLGLGYLDYTVVLEEIARVSASYAVGVAVTGLPQVILKMFGTEAQREQWLPGLAAGELLGGFALSEAGSGSDAASLKTTATRRGDTYVLDGTKQWITHGGYGDLYVVMARTGGPGARGVSAFLVPGDAPGLSAGKKEEKMGLRASATAELVLSGVEVPASARLGDEGTGFRVAMAALDSGRITIGAVAVGLSAAALDASAAYASEREQFGKAIIDFQGVGFMLAEPPGFATRAESTAWPPPWPSCTPRTPRWP